MDHRVFEAGQGPRRNDDFSLHVARFPPYVIPPDRWNGIVGLSGSGGTGEGRSKRVTNVRFYYLDRAGDPDRGIERVYVESEEVRHQPDMPVAAGEGCLEVFWRGLGSASSP